MVDPLANAPLRVLLIGVDAYTAGVPALHGCVNDIDSVQRLLIDRLGVAPERIRRLASPHPEDAHETDVAAAPATRQNIVEAFEALASEAVTADERVFVYYSGHGADVPVVDGATKEMREALVPVDASVLDRPSGFLYDVELNRLLQRVARRTSQLTFVLDCCHSGGATRDVLTLPGERTRAVQVTRAAAGPSRAPAETERGIGAAQGTFADWQVVAACLADEKALECEDDAGRKHGLLTQTLLRALATIPDAELASVSWGRLWRGVVSSVESRRPQHPTLTGSFARPVFGGLARPGDVGLAVTRTASGYSLDAGELFGVTAGAKLAVYGATPAVFPAVGSTEDLAARVGVLSVTAAKRPTAVAVAEGDAFELPTGARARLIEAGEAARVTVALTFPDPAIEATIKASKRVRLAADGEAAAVRVERHGEGEGAHR